MTEIPSVAWLCGRVVDFGSAGVGLDDRGLQFGESLYEVVAVTAGRARFVHEHADRMRQAAAVLEIAAGVPDDDTWAAMIEALLRKDPLQEGILYAQVTGGSAVRRHVPDVRPEPTFFAYLQPFRFPRRPQVEAGIDLITMVDPRWARCDLKTTMLLPAILAKSAAIRAGAGEALFIGSDGMVHEGASSNLFLVESGRIVTPSQTSSLLPGITRPTVANLAREAHLEVLDEPVALDRLLAADEAFVTSTTFLVMPIVSIDGQPIGGGVSGPLSCELAERLRRHLELD